MKGKRLFVNTLIVSLASVLFRLMGLGFQIFLASRMGPGGIGLFQLVMSVNVFMATLAISGIRFAATRVISEKIGRGQSGDLRPTVRCALGYAFTAGTFAFLIIFLISGFLGERVIGDARTVLSLRILGVSLPFVSGGAALSGYFTGVCRPGKGALGAFSEQVIKIIVSCILLSLAPHDDLELTCAAVVTGNTVGEILSFFVYLWLYRRDVGGEESGGGEGKRLIFHRLSSVAVPLALAAYARTALNTVQNLLIPKGLERSGATRDGALSDYGKIQGMVFPIITFPQIIFQSVSELVVPELTEEQVRGRGDVIESSSRILLKLCLVFSVGVMGALYASADLMGDVFYRGENVAAHIRELSFLMPIMYMDTVTDGMLRGLGQHMYSMKLNIVDSLLSSALVIILLPRFAVRGYIVILYASEIFNFTFSILRLSKLTRLPGLVPDILKTLFCALGAGSLTQLLLKRAEGGWAVLLAALTVYTAAYCVCVLLLEGKISLNKALVSGNSKCVSAKEE